MGTEIILASASPRRREILAEIVPAFQICPAECGEEVNDTLSPRELVEHLARQKAENVFSRFPSAAVLGADTIVYFGGRVLGKPSGAKEAKRTLRSLSGKTHSVFTGYCILWGDTCVTGACETLVEFNELSDAFIEEYVAGGSPLDKAGSYGIQDDARLVKAYRGSYTNIVGLPKEEIEKQFRKIGLLQ
ncbi:MAG TPA: septum formation protein Maf [Candidatus Borkfalkia excrementigallinarum]|uniref:dTTP/UTP pyrophosphatase n=1 Tax=Candidatus Borkfalkia excrementigallinarum TaxID=2838506 RepID=A0A9D2CT11_9FIRM|nr:septum formation protein Maf [Candidatus Borkfalkia excrementigallinarum]